MKFNVELSKDDIQAQTENIKEIFSLPDEQSQDAGSEVKACLKIFQNTFENEICPNCLTGELKPNHLSSMYNIIVKNCCLCNYFKTTSLKE